jgi:hypothetical protein
MSPDLAQIKQLALVFRELVHKLVSDKLDLFGEQPNFVPKFNNPGLSSDEWDKVELTAILFKST